MKPDVILKIEKKFKVKLELLKYVNFEEPETSDSYFVNSNNEVIGLCLRWKKIKDFTFFKELSNLQILDLRYTYIDDYSFLNDLKFLIKLDLSNNSIEDISFLKNLKSLKYLLLDKNRIIDYSPLLDLKDLVFLSLYKNEINNIDFLNGLNKIEVLYLRENNIIDISNLSNLISLRILDLKSNSISDISSLKNLKKIIFLDLCKNKIENIYPLKFLVQLGVPIIKKENSRLQIGIHLRDNPLQNPSYDIIKQGPSAIIRFFDKIESEGFDKIYEVKVTLVGEGNAGKTSLINRILDSKANLPREDKRTRGISIKDWVFKKSSITKHIAHIWDFGGQDVYYPVHRFFLTENSVFVLLASSRQNTHEFDYWIPTIFQFGGRSPIIIAQTCHEGMTKHWNDIGVYLANDNFNIIKDQVLNYHEINLLKKNKGLLNIKRSIINQIINLPHYKKNVPKSWIYVRALIDSLKKINCISYLELKIKIQELNPSSFSSKEDVEDCIKFFHSIGVLLWYHSEHKLKDWVILNPKWAVDAVYKIIDHKKQTNKGIILAKDFDSVWNAKMYEDKHHILKEMLEVFKIAFPKKNNVVDFIMPTRLDSIPNGEIWEDNENYLSIVYNFEFMPKGLVNQISAELSRYIVSDDQVWNNAVNFIDKDTYSQVFENFYERRIIVKAKGQDARGIIKLIMNAVDNITDGYKGVKSYISIPCICSECLNKPKPDFYNYELLLDKIKENKNNVTCFKSDEVLKIETLLFNIGLTNPNKIKVKSEVQILENEVVKSNHDVKEKEIKAFVTYSWTDGENKFDEKHQKNVGKFVNQLRTIWKIDAEFDLHQTEINFIKMMYSNLYKSDKIIIVLSEGYALKANGFVASGVEVEYSAIINDIRTNPSKYILVSFDDRSKTKIPFGFQGNDVIVINEDLNSSIDLTLEQNRLVSKLTGEPIVDKPNLGGKLPAVRKKKFN